MYREENRQVPGHVRLPADFEITTAPDYRAARPPVRLPAQGQLLRRLDPGHLGAVHPRPGGLRDQRLRDDPPALGRRRRQPPLPAAADRDDGHHLRDPGQVRPGRVDLVPGPGRGLHRPGPGGVRPRGVGRGLREDAPDRRHLRPRRGPRSHPAQGVVPVPREAGGGAEAPPPRGGDVDVAPGLHRPVDDRLLRSAERGAGVAGRDRPRTLAARRPLHAPEEDPRPLSDAPLPGHHPQPELPVPGPRVGPGLRHDREPRGHQPPPPRRDRHLPQVRRGRRATSSPTPRASTTTSTRSSGAAWAGTGTPTRTTPCAASAATSSGRATPTPSPRGCWPSSGTGRVPS